MVKRNMARLRDNQEEEEKKSRNNVMLVSLPVLLLLHGAQLKEKEVLYVSLQALFLEQWLEQKEVQLNLNDKGHERDGICLDL